MQCYIIKDKSGKFVALDDASGGYPYFVEEWYQAKIWNDQERARRYMSSFSSGTSYKHTWTLEMITPMFSQT